MDKNLKIKKSFSWEDVSAARLRFARPHEQVLVIGLPNNNRLTLVSTAHISKESVNLVESAIRLYSPDAVAVELDSRRLQAIEKSNFNDIDIIQIIKKGQGYFFLAFLLLSIYQKKMAERTGSEPGAEMKKAVELSREKNLELLLIDRSIDLTLKRIFAAIGFFRRLFFLASFLSFEMPKKEKEDEVKKPTSTSSKKKSVKKQDDSDLGIEEELKKVMEEQSLLKMRKEMRVMAPEIIKVLLDERDRFMVLKLQNYFAEKKNAHVLAVVGAAHARGITDGMMKNFFIEKSIPELSTVPNRRGHLRKLALIVPVGVFALIGYGFYQGNYDMVGEGIGWWILLNGSFSAVGALIALGHPITIMVAFFAAPLTSLNPAIGVGMLTALVEIYFRPPRVKDFEQAQIQFSAIKKWWSNRLTKVLLVFFLSNLGSAIGTWIALPYLAKLLL